MYRAAKIEIAGPITIEMSQPMIGMIPRTNEMTKMTAISTIRAMM